MAPDRATIRPRMMRASTLDVLNRAVQDGDVAGHDEAWAELVEAGVATTDRQLLPHWRELLTGASQAPVRFDVESRMGRAGMRSLISLTARYGLSITERRRLTVTDTEIVVDAVEDVVEVALFEPADIWPAVQRVLPPSHLVRADGGTNPRDERTVGVLRDAPERSAMPEDLLVDLAGADVEVHLMLQVDNGTDLPFVTSRHWLEGGRDQLLEVRLLDGSVEVVRVPTGTIADEVVWLTVGAHDIRSRTVA